MVAMAGAGVVACHRPAQPATAAPQARTPSDYVSPPDLLQASRLPGGAVVLSGTATPGAAVRLASPNGSALLGAASDAGVWTVTTPASDVPRL